ncbi:MAG: hypothetical protein O9294_19005 [Cytophagales bacterium]|nr:hypothetical protein [Cytophagales bacterium]
MKLELINLNKQTANRQSNSRTKATPNSLDRCGQWRGTKNLQSNFDNI